MDERTELSVLGNSNDKDFDRGHKGGEGKYLNNQLVFPKRKIGQISSSQLLPCPVPEPSMSARAESKEDDRYRTMAR